MQPIIAFFKDRVLTEDKEAHKIRRKVVHFVLQDDVLYKRDLFSILFWCTWGEDTNYVLQEIYESIRDNHIGGLALAHKMFRQGYYWSTLKNGTLHFVRKYD